MMPRIPSGQEIDLLSFGLGWGLDIKGRDIGCLCIKARLSIHRHVNQESESVSNSQRLLYSSCVLGKALVAAIDGSILSRGRNHDASHATKVGIVDLDVEDLAGYD